MKGEPSAPRCGFSRQIVEILNQTGVPFSHFDVLSDEEIRQGLKKYSDWPTYPQLYVKGELLGGLDIIKEMSQEELKGALQPTSEAMQSWVFRSSNSATFSFLAKLQGLKTVISVKFLSEVQSLLPLFCFLSLLLNLKLTKFLN